MSTDLKSLFDSSTLYDQYAVTITIRERMDGGVPKDPEMIRGWVASRTGHEDDTTEAQIKAHLPDIEAATEAVAQSSWCGFKKDTRGYYVEARQVKAMLRESSTLLGITKKKRGSKQIVQHGFEVRGHGGGSKVYLKHPTDDMADPDIQNEERAIHVVTAQGPRSALKRTDYVEAGTRLTFQIWVLGTAPQETRHIGHDTLVQMLKHAQENGLGANRSQGSGKFDVTGFEVLHKAEVKAPEKKEPKKKATRPTAARGSSPRS